MSGHDELRTALTRLADSVASVLAQIRTELETLNTDDPDTEDIANKISRLTDGLDRDVQAAQAAAKAHGGSGGSSGGNPAGSGSAPPAPPSAPAGTPPGA